MPGERQREERRGEGRGKACMTGALVASHYSFCGRAKVDGGDEFGLHNLPPITITARGGKERKGKERVCRCDVLLD